MSAIRPDDYAFHHYLHMQDKTALARARLEAASAHLELAAIRERLAKLKSQYEPLATLEQAGDLALREKLYAAAFYAVVGRMP